VTRSPLDPAAPAWFRSEVAPVAAVARREPRPDAARRVGSAVLGRLVGGRRNARKAFAGLAPR
jgi:hypothetical protein